MTDDLGRYNREHKYGRVRFTLTDFIPDEDQCRILMLKVLEQAVRDYCSLAESSIQSEQNLWATARGFLFDDDYYFHWGTLETNLEQFLDIIDIDIGWVREQTQKKFQERNKVKYHAKEKDKKRNSK